MNFSLSPFEHSSVSSLPGSLTRAGSKLVLSFHNIVLPEVHWPSFTLAPERRDNLWQSTCFECFVGIQGHHQYLEINGSPTGHWQAYQFSGYRELIGPAQQVNVKVSATSNGTSQKSIHVEVDIDHPDFVTKDWQISVSAILALSSGLAYYALEHPATQPDFHLPELRTLDLPFQPITG